MARGQLSCRYDRLANEDPGSLGLNSDAKRVDTVTECHITVEGNKWQGEGSGEGDVRVTWRSERKRQFASRNPEEARYDVIDCSAVGGVFLSCL